ncbi:MAG: radical SAM protein [Desulfatibacillaceae bacterium]
MRTKQYGTGAKRRRIHLVVPKTPDNFWNMQGTANMLGAKTLMPNSAVATLMALTPPDVCVEYVLSDENVAPLDPDLPCDLVAVTGNIVHAKRIEELCPDLRARGHAVALGGPFASLNRERCRGLANHLFIGEAEYTWPRFLREWAGGNAGAEYVQEEKLDLADSPPPDWSLIRARDYINIPVQTSRGCPNRCDFCDVVQYVGHKYRHKSADQVLAEVKNAHAIGGRTVFFSDDNFLGDKRFTRSLLAKVIEWNMEQTRPLSFSTQITVEVARDPDLLKQFADARFSVLFLGVETPRAESLRDVNKMQNLAHDMGEGIRAIGKMGIVPFLGLMVGFDHDDETVFGEISRFVRDTNSPIVGLSLLNAPPGTPLYRRLEKEGRIAGPGFDGDWQLGTNVVPLRMTTGELVARTWDLYREVYDPGVFLERLTSWLASVEYRGAEYPKKRFDPATLGRVGRILSYVLFKSDPAVRRCFRESVAQTRRINPALFRRTFTLFTQYAHCFEYGQRYAGGPG